MEKARPFAAIVLSGLLAIVFSNLLFAKDEAKHIEWLPVTPEDLALKDNPASPGASAMILFRETDTDDMKGFELNYYRIKIFNDEGKKYADISIPFTKDETRVDEIEARTIHPDGKIVDFDGDIFEKVVAKHKGSSFLARTFTLPDVQVGSIIEYRYRTRWAALPPELLSDPAVYFILAKLSPELATRWIVQDSLFTRRAHFSFTPAPIAGLDYAWFDLPGGVKPSSEGGVIKLNVNNVPPFVEEEYMPPEQVMKARVDFFYVFRRPDKADIKTTDWFWKDQGKKIDENVERFIGKRKGIDREIDGLVASGDPPEIKLQKFYQRAQGIRNLTFEHEKTEKEEKREKLKDNQNVEDVLKHGYGDATEINEVFAAMARSAGFDAHLVEVAGRNRVFFTPAVLDIGQFRGNVVEVQVGDKLRYFDPATPNCPYGLLSWEETGVRGLRLEKDGGVLVSTPPPQSSDATLERKATLQMEPDGGLQGKIVVNYVGQEGLSRRLENRDKGEPERRKYLVDEMKDWLPGGSTVELASVPNWDKPTETLRAEFTVKIPSLGTSTGRRLLFPPAIFQANKRYPFDSQNRVHPVYFHYPFQEADDITMQLPQGYQQESLPKPRNENAPFGHYEVAYEGQGGAVHLTRRFVIDGILFPPNYYPSLRAFFSSARAGDEQQMVLKSVEAAPAK